MPITVQMAKAPTFSLLAGEDGSPHASGGPRPLLRLCRDTLPPRSRLLWTFSGTRTRRLVDGLCDEIAKACCGKEVEEALVYWERRQESTQLKWKLWHRHFLPECDALIAQFNRLLAERFPQLGRQQLRVFAGEAVSLMAAADLAGTSLQWQHNGANLPGETGSLLHFQAVDPKASGVYRVVAKTPTGIEISNEVTLDVVAKLSPTILAQPHVDAVRLGESWSGTVEVEGVGKLQFVWEFEGQPIPGATERTLSLGCIAPQNLGTYRVRVSNAHGTVVSDDIVLREHPGP